MKKLLSIEDLKKLKSQKKIIGLCNGVFDIFIASKNCLTLYVHLKQNEVNVHLPNTRKQLFMNINSINSPVITDDVE